MYTLKVFRGALLFGAALSTFAQTAAKRPLNHLDYDSWNAIQSQALSRDGKFLAYSLVPEEGDGQLVVRNLSTGKELRESCGSAPPAAENNSEEPTGEGPPPVRSIRISFTHDNAFLVASTFPPKAETDKAKKERKRPDEMPRGGMIIVNLTELRATRVTDVASFQVPELGGSYVVYLHGPKPAAAGSSADGAQDSDQARGGRGANAGGRGPRNKYGSDLVLRELPSSKERTFEDVVDYTIAKDSKVLLYAVGSRKDQTNGVYSVTPGSDAAAASLLAGKGQYTKLTWDFAGRHLVFLSDRDDQGSKPAKFKAYLWDRSGAPAEAVSTATAGFRAGYGILDRGPISFSRDGSRLFLSCAPLEEIAALEKEAPPPAPVPSDDKVQADLWSWRDDYVQPMQKVRAAQDRSRSYRAVYRLSDKTFQQISDPAMAGLFPSDDGRVALGTDDRAYRHMVDYDGAYNDVYLVDTATGARQLALKKFRGPIGVSGGRGGGGGGVQLSPDGTHAIAFKDKQWWSIGVADAKMANLTSQLGVAVHNEDDDHPDEPPAYGAGGWTKDGKWALVYDRYDIWAVSPDGAQPRKLTDGRKSEVQFRVVRLDSDQEEERGIDTSKPLLLRAENLETRDTGFYSLASFGAQPQKLLMGAKSYRTIGKAKDADVIMVTATTFHDEPDIHITDSSFRSLKKVTEANPQQKQILFGSAEMIHYRNADGALLEAALYKPENFDPSKKYPMMIYLYERLSQNLHTYTRPAPGHSINITYYVSNGYLVLTPDIIYT
ncbi:MAG TPA: hypothetical protein VGH38_20110, partial [Bryobacteraceae bacterium]